MEVTKSMMDNELRTMGVLFRFFAGTLFTKTKLRFLSKRPKRREPSERTLLNNDLMTIQEVWIPRNDEGTIRVLVMSPQNVSAPLPAIVWFHGGGYGMGKPEMGIPRFKAFLQKRPCIMISPDYRLSTEVPYPAALDDCYQTLLWTKNNAAQLSIRANQLFMGGDSAGGGLSAALALYARDKQEVSIAFQMPLYPMLDDRMRSESATNNDAPVWNSASNRYAWKLYLGELFGGEQVPAYAAPARATDFSGLPPTATFVGDLEPFRDETIHYVENLKRAGVKVAFQLCKGCYHGFDVLNPKAKVSMEAINFLTSHFAYAVDHYFAEQPG